MPPELIASPSRQTSLRWALPLLILPPFLGGVDLTLFNSVAHSLPGLGKEWTLWFIDSYSIMLAAGVVAASRLGARFGPGRTLVGGLLLFAASSTLPAVTQSEPLWTASRCVQGLGYALMISSVVSCIGVLYEGPARNRAYSMWSMAASIGAGSGPLIGKAALDADQYRLLFVIPAVLAAVSALPTWLVLKSVSLGKSNSTTIDLASCALAFIGFAGVVGSLQLRADAIWRILAFIVGCIFLMLFMQRQRKSADPLVDVSMLRFSHLGGASLVLIAVYACYAGSVYLFGATASDWLSLIPVSLLAVWVTLGGAILAYIPNEWPAMRVLRGCVFVCAIGLLLAAFVGPFVGGVLIGLSAGLGTPAAGAAMVSRAGEGGVARAGALQETGFGLGAALGVAGFGGLLSSSGSVFATCVITAIAMLCAAALVGKSKSLSSPI